MAEKRRLTQTIMIVAAVLVAVVVVARVFSRQAPLVPVVDVTREDLNVSITSNGKVEPIDATVAHAEFPTFVEKVMAIEGQAVRRGQTILTLDAADIRSQLAQARASLLSAQNDLRNARAGGPPEEVAKLRGDLQAAKVQVENLERNEKALEDLVASKAATPDELAQTQANLAKERANLEALEAKKKDLDQRASETVESATLRVNQFQESVDALAEKVRSATVVAPTDGTLYSLPVRAGDNLKVGDTLAEMADLRHIRVRAFVDEPDLGLLEPKQAVEITWDAKPGRMWTGETEEAPKQVVPHGMRSVGEVLCSVDNSKIELLPNTNVQVKILVRERRGALVVPRAAVHEGDKGQHYVWVFDGERVQRRDISIGVASASKYEVLSGLAPDDRIAEPADEELKNGMEIRAGEAK